MNVSIEEKIPGMDNEAKLRIIRQNLEAREISHLCRHAAFSCDAVRRFYEKRQGHRPDFAVDTDRILHSRAYTRYIDKTQVFYMIKNDHITHRVLHVQLVSRIARTIGRVFRLNEDLIEAIALGHDIGHPPFGHDGEKMLHALCLEHGLPSFGHNIQSVQFLEKIERSGRGWNLTVQTLDGILCHDGEIHNRTLKPTGKYSFSDFDVKLKKKSIDPKIVLTPMTMEGCVVRFADTISYIGRDIEDAIELKLISREEIPRHCQDVLGKTNGTIVHNLVADLLKNSIGDNILAFSKDISQALRELKKFNYKRIYFNPEIKKDAKIIEKCYQLMFPAYLDHLVKDRRESAIFTEFLDKLGTGYEENHQPASIVRDFVSGMTDDYFLSQAALFGCKIPTKK